MSDRITRRLLEHCGASRSSPEVIIMLPGEDLRLCTAADRTAIVELTESDEAECLRLLARGTIGRVIFTESALPASKPVTSLLDGRSSCSASEAKASWLRPPGAGL